VLALLAAAVVLIALAAATFTLSYSGIHEIALGAGVPPRLARVYPGLLDAALVVACLAAIVLWDGRWWARWYAWLAIIVMVAVGGGADALHAMNVALPHRKAAGVIAVVPWLLLLLAFSLWLTVLRQSRSRRGTAPQDPPEATLGAREVMTPAHAPRPTRIPQPPTVPEPTVPALTTAPAPVTIPAVTVIPVPAAAQTTAAQAAADSDAPAPAQAAADPGTPAPGNDEGQPDDAGPDDPVADRVGLDDLLSPGPEDAWQEAAAWRDDSAAEEGEAATPADSAPAAETAAAEDSAEEDARPVAAEPEAAGPADVPAEADPSAEESMAAGEDANDEVRGGAEGEAPEAVAVTEEATISEEDAVPEEDAIPEEADRVPEPEAIAEAGPASAAAATHDEGTVAEAKDADAEGTAARAEDADAEDAAVEAKDVDAEGADSGVTPPPDADDQAADDQIPAPAPSRTPDYWDIEDGDDVPGGTYPVLSAPTESPEETNAASKDTAPGDDEPSPEERGTSRPGGTLPTEVHHSLSDLAAQAPPLPLPSARRLNRLRSTPVPPEEDTEERSLCPRPFYDEAPPASARLRGRAGSVAAAGPCTRWHRYCCGTLHALAPFPALWRMRRVRYMRCRAASMAALLPPGNSATRFRWSGFSEERRLKPQITIGLLTGQDGFPLTLLLFCI
jgi:hypothetical protein